MFPLGPCGSSTTRLLPESATNTSPKSSTATPIGMGEAELPETIETTSLHLDVLRDWAESVGFGKPS